MVGGLIPPTLGIPLVGLFTGVPQMVSTIPMPTVVMVASIGISSISGPAFDLMLMVGFGAMGRVLCDLTVSLVTVILGILFCNEMETNLRRSMAVSGGAWPTLFGGPLAPPISMGGRVERRMEKRSGPTK